MDQRASLPALSRRKSAKAASSAITEQLNSDSVSGSSDAEGTKRRGSVKRKYGKRARAKLQRGPARLKNQLGSPETTKRTDMSNTPSESGPQDTYSKQGSASHPKEPNVGAVINHLEADIDELSDLTSLSDNESAPAKEMEKQKILKPRPTSTRKLSTSGSIKAKHTPVVKTFELGACVWVLIEPKSLHVYDQERDEGNKVERIWWPGKVRVSNTSTNLMKVKLFGQESRMVQVRTPSPANTKLQSTPVSKLRFKTMTYVPPRPIIIEDEDDGQNPKKKQKGTEDDLQRKWNNAVSEMKFDSRSFSVDGLRVDDNLPFPDASDDSDELPEYLSILRTPVASTSKSTPTTSRLQFARDVGKAGDKREGKRKRADKFDVSANEYGDVKMDSAEAFWEPPGPDEFLRVPGELVLARESAGSSIYWPSRIENYLPPLNHKQQGRYTVTWLDGTVQDIPRTWLYSMMDEEFYTCKIGEFASSTKEVQNNEDNDMNIISPGGYVSPMLDPSPTHEEFCGFPIEKQLAYTRKVLWAIVDGQYLPVQVQVNQFMKGGRAKQSIVEGASRRGRVDPVDVERVSSLIKRIFIAAPPELAESDSVDVEGPTTAEGLDGAGVTEPSSKEDSSLPQNQYLSLASPPLTDRLLSSPPNSLSISILEPPSSSLTDVEPQTAVSKDALSPPMSSFMPAGEEIEVGSIASANTELDQSLLQESRSSVFASLNVLEKMEFCDNILQPEALRQILLWRFGDRTTAELLSPEEEERLYNIGEDHLNETDWVFDIMRMRNKGAKKESQGHNKPASSFGRSQRNRTFVNYQE